MDSLFFVDSKGRLLLGRNYKRPQDLDLLAQQFFRNGIFENTPPIFKVDDHYFIFLSHNSLYLVSSTKTSSDAILVTTFLLNFIKLIEHYIVKLEEESVRDNYVLIYELLDEAVDYGIVQMTDIKTVAEVVTQKGYALFEKPKKETIGLGSSVSWRPDNIKHKKNEVYLDVVEKVNLIASSSGDVISCDIIGEVFIKCYLSGMPELKLGINDRAMIENSHISRGVGSPPENNGTGIIELEDVKFHQCVQISKFENDKVISFIPPDGEFILMTYRSVCSDQKPLIWLECVIERQSETGIEMFVRIRSQFKKRSAANNVQVSIPVPDDIDNPKMKANIGSAKYKAEMNSIVWKIGYFPGGKEFSLNLRMGRPSIKNEDVLNEKKSSAESLFGIRRPIVVTFELPYYTLSGIQVRYLKIMEKSGYNALPWVRYITKNGLYQFRMPEKNN